MYVYEEIYIYIYASLIWCVCVYKDMSICFNSEYPLVTTTILPYKIPIYTPLRSLDYGSYRDISICIWTSSYLSSCLKFMAAYWS